MKNLTLLFLLCTFLGNSQSSNQQWQSTRGGSGYEFAYSVCQTSDGGYITTGYTESTDGDLSWNNGSGDCWVIKYTATGNVEWHKIYGGTQMDYGYSIEQTTDGGYIIAGYSESYDGDVIGQQGSGDTWVLKLTSSGAIDWQRMIGGSQFDSGQSIHQTPDGGYIVAGYTGSNDGDILLNHGGGDCFSAKLDAAGATEWIKCYGGTNYDCTQSIRPTLDGGYVFAGYSHSVDGNVSVNHGNGDWWIVKTDAVGVIEWEKSYGGTDYECAQSIRQSTDGGFILAGYTESLNMDVTGNHGNGDLWIVKLENNGSMEWSKCIGSSLSDYGYSIVQMTDGTFLTAGYSGTSDGDVSGNHGNYDAWIVRISPSGNLVEEHSVGGSSVDIIYDITSTIDGGYILAGYSESNDGHVSGNHGGGDCWMFKSAAGNVSVGEQENNNKPFVSMQTDGSIYFHNLSGDDTIRIYDITGKLILTEKCSSHYFKYFMGNESHGVYVYSISAPNNKMSSGKIVLY